MTKCIFFILALTVCQLPATSCRCIALTAQSSVDNLVKIMLYLQFKQALNGPSAELLTFGPFSASLCSQGGGKKDWQVKFISITHFTGNAIQSAAHEKQKERKVRCSGIEATQTV